MMTSRRLLEHVNAEPFEPFRIRMNSGALYSVNHPEMIFVGKNVAKVYGVSEDGGDEKSWAHELSIILMEAIEFSDAATGN